MTERITAFVEKMQIAPDDRVLEIGCGHGVAASLICAQLTTGHYVALERSLKMISAASARNAKFVSAQKAEFLHGELESFDFGDRRFDRILAMRVGLFHREPTRACQLAERWLAPDGKLFVEYDQP